MVRWWSSDIQSVTVNYWRTLFGTVSIAAITRERGHQRKSGAFVLVWALISAHICLKESFMVFGKDEYLWQSDSEHWELLLVLTKNWKSVCHIFGLFFDRINVSDRYFWIVYLCYKIRRKNECVWINEILYFRHIKAIDGSIANGHCKIYRSLWMICTAIRLSGDCQLRTGAHAFQCFVAKCDWKRHIY